MAAPAAGGSSGGDVEVSRAAEDKLTFKLALAAEVKCEPLIAAYNACMAGRTVTGPFACRAAYAASRECIAEYVNGPNIAALKSRWVAAGRPQWPDWHALLRGLVAAEHIAALPRRDANMQQGAAAPAGGVAGAGSGGAAGAGSHQQPQQDGAAAR